MKTLVISDQPSSLAAFLTNFRSIAPDASLREVGGLAEAITLLAATDFDLVVLDLDTQNANRVKGARLLLQLWETLALVAISQTHHDDDVIRCIDIGALGYLLKDDSADTLRSAFERIAAGNVYVPEFQLDVARVAAEPAEPSMNARLRAIAPNGMSKFAITRPLAL
jgi:DNA-binding NarL/FixJ family response regulator